MTAASNPPDDPADAAALAEHAHALAVDIERAIPGWIVRCVEQGLRRDGRELDDAVHGRAEAAGRRAQAEGARRVGQLLATDVDEQRSGPLEILRSLCSYATEVLRAEHVPPVARDEFATRSFPDDDYDLAPATFADVDRSLHEPGIVWGAAKAHIVLARRRREGKR